MNPLRYCHTVRISRRPDEPTDLELDQEAFAVVHGSVPCLLEPVSARRRESILGEISQAQLLMTFGTQAVEEGDLVTILAGPGVTAGMEFEVEQVLPDTMRPTGVPYQVASLVRAATDLTP